MSKSTFGANVVGSVVVGVVLVVAFLSILRSDFVSDTVADMWSSLFALTTGDQYIVPESYACISCRVERYVRIAADFNGDGEYGPRCILYEGDVIRIKGTAGDHVVAELAKQESTVVSGHSNAAACKMGQAIVFSGEEWRWFLGDIQEARKNKKLVEEIHRYAVR